MFQFIPSSFTNVYRFVRYATGCVLCLVGLSGASQVTAADFVTSVPKFELDIQPILTAHGCNAGACHGKSRGQNGFALSLLGFDADFDYHALVNEARGRRLFPAVPQRSLLLAKGAGKVPHGGGVKLPEESAAYQAIVQWIEAGMPRASAEDPVFERIEISPQPQPLSPGQQLSLTVTAFYSNGTSRDVTRTSFFQSSETPVVAVNEIGQLTAGKLPGEATIMARYMGQIATWSTVIPRPEPIELSLYDNLPANNFIDRLVWNKLKDLNILPSEPISDEKYLRRVHLDLIGRLPTADEVRAFLSDAGEDKRVRLVDSLLDRPEYADFWANKWADLLRPNPYRVGIKATQSLDSWLRDAFRRNLPLDEFASGLITAKGSTWRNGAVTVFRDRRSPEEITTMFSQLFLGVRLDCAKCHQHPFEVYSQHDFYSLAAYFAKVGYKGTGLSPPISGGEEIVLVSSKGDVKHPLTGEILKPAPLKGTPVDVPQGEDPRQHFAEWLTGAGGDRFARAMVNRIWGELFKVGIVDAVDDIRATNPPSNPALLEALATEFKKLNYNQKELLKLITSSYIYGLSSLPNETNAGDSRNFSRHYRRLARAEVVTDALADVIGVPDNFEGMPQEARAIQLWTFRSPSETLDTFGRPDPNQDPPCERLPEATMTQALHLMNAPSIQAKLTSDQGLPAQLASGQGTFTSGQGTGGSQLTNDEIVEELYLRVYSRIPSELERQRILPLLADQTVNRRQVLEDILWSLLNTPEFVYED